jgi:hypothetical protein
MQYFCYLIGLRPINDAIATERVILQFLKFSYFYITLVGILIISVSKLYRFIWVIICFII